ncbi:MAG: ABC transporter substrate-binding protein [Agrobacterium tumefaciens]|nr:ABC transporter substrate-binding protein [Agrobacterium tumefaciens]
MKKLLATTCLTIGVLLSFGGAKAADCGSVSIVSLSWASSELLAYVDEFILKNGYGCDASVVVGDTVPTQTSMAERGQPDIVSESWTSTRPPVTQQAIKDGKLVVAGKVFTDGGVQGIYVPKFLIEKHPDIKTIADALKHPELFPDPQDSSKAAWYAGAQGWGATIFATQYYKAYGAKDAGFNLIDSGSAAAHDGALINAYNKGRGWIGYYWDPTALLGKYDMVRLSAGVPYDAAEWARCNEVESCPDPKPNEWPTDEVGTVVTKAFAERGGSAYEFLTKRSWPNKVVSEMLAWMTDNQATGADAAQQFLKAYEPVWTAWVPADVAAKVKAAR